MLRPQSLSPDRCEYLDAELGIRLIFDNLIASSRGGIEAWCVIRWHGQVPEPRPLAHGRYDLMGARTVSSLVSEICESANWLKKDDIRVAVSDAVFDSIAIVQNGAPPERLAAIDSKRNHWLLRPLVEAGSVTRLIAPGGSLKSLLALTVAVTVSTGYPKLLGLKPSVTGPVLYLDWESDGSSHAERLRAICAATNLSDPDIYYLRMSGSLSRNQRAVMSAVHDCGAVMAVVDSAAMARGAAGEGPAEDSTLRLFAAIRSLNVPALVIDHKTLMQAKNKEKGGYGSVFNQNLSRLEWEVSRLVREGSTTSMVLTLEKANNARVGQELGFQFSISANEDDRWERVFAAPVDPYTVVDFGERPPGDRLVDFLLRAKEPQTVASICDELDMTPAQARKMLNEDSRFENIGSRDGAGSTPGLWRLNAQDERIVVPF